jgi:hypothetical protein
MEEILKSEYLLGLIGGMQMVDLSNTIEERMAEHTWIVQSII